MYKYFMRNVHYSKSGSSLGDEYEVTMEDVMRSLTVQGFGAFRTYGSADIPIVLEHLHKRGEINLDHRRIICRKVEES